MDKSGPISGPFFLYDPFWNVHLELKVIKCFFSTISYSFIAMGLSYSSWHCYQQNVTLFLPRISQGTLNPVFLDIPVLYLQETGFIPCTTVVFSVVPTFHILMCEIYSVFPWIYPYASICMNNPGAEVKWISEQPMGLKTVICPCKTSWLRCVSFAGNGKISGPKGRKATT